MKSSGIIRQLTADLLSRAGAIVDRAEDGTLDVMPGANLGRALGLAEFERLAFEPGVPGAKWVDYDAPLVDRLATVVDCLGRIARVQVPPAPLKTLDAATAIERGVPIRNGVVRERGHAAVDSLYAGVAFEYTLLADERMGGIVTVWVNPATRSTAGFDSRIETAVLHDERGEAPGVAAIDDRTAWWPLAAASARARIAPDTADFVDRLRRRRDRDLRRLREYYEEIDREIRRKLSRPTLADDQVRRERERLDATHQACRSRAAEAADRYRARLRLSPIGVWLCRVPSYRVSVRLMRRRAAADVAFSWNPIDGRIEPRACDGCLAPVTDGAWLCDEKVHYLCGACLAPCPECDRRFCRACSSTCPRLHPVRAPRPDHEST